MFFQVLDGQGNVKVNEAFHGPLIGVLEELENRLVVRNQEREVTVGLFRITEPQAYYLLSQMCANGDLESVGQGRGAFYVRKRTK